MSSKARRRSSSIDRVGSQTEKRALNSARKVPWRILAEAADEYTGWQTFALWLRGVLDCCEALPQEIAVQIEKRSPILLTHIGDRVAVQEGTPADEEVADRPGERGRSYRGVRQAKLGMMREALAKLDRLANERSGNSFTEKAG